ncbi:hypothetical protein ACFE04_026761 [Oxalis oulophora]
MEGEKGIVCVTGGTGFIASWLIKSLLEDGFSVHTTVRPDPENKRDLSFLTKLPRASSNLKIFTADLSVPASFEPAIEGCSGVFHVASPMFFDNAESEQALTKHVVEGTLGILKSCLKFKSTVKRVVYTSSVAAVVHNRQQTNDLLIDESYWSDIDFARATKSFNRFSYIVSKTLAEKTALEFCEEHGLDIVTLLPTYVVGPFLCPQIAGSVRLMLAFILGNEESFPKYFNIPMVHVDDVARAHIFLMQHPDVKGRYICSFDTVTLDGMVEFLSTRYPEYPVLKADNLKDFESLGSFSSKKLLDAGFKFKYGFEQMFDDAIGCCKEKGYL